MSKRPSRVAWFTSTRGVSQEPQNCEFFQLDNKSTSATLQFKSDDATSKAN